jgi:hypothetical protein
MEPIDFFIAHAGADKAPAEALYSHLVPKKVRVYLDTHDLRPGSLWPLELKRALKVTRITVVLISAHSDNSFYQQEEVAIAINLLRSGSTAHHVVPVFLIGSVPEHAPYGLAQMHALFEDKLTMRGVANELMMVLAGLPTRTPLDSLARSVAVLDEVWDTAEPLYVEPNPAEHSVKFGTRDGAMVQLVHGSEEKRITRDQFEQRLTPEELKQVAVLEKAMEINLAVWDEAHPQRVLDATQRQRDLSAVDAMAEDLHRVLRLVERAGFWLDDHYLRIRDVVEPVSGSK